MVKTYEEWDGSLNEYLQVGDIVDEEIYNHFINVLPPAMMRSSCTQMGEPYSHVNGKATFSTLQWTDQGWMYCGNCHIGETVEPVEESII
jgi:hypothetical protein